MVNFIAAASGAKTDVIAESASADLDPEALYPGDPEMRETGT